MKFSKFIIKTLIIFISFFIIYIIFIPKQVQATDVDVSQPDYYFIIEKGENTTITLKNIVATKTPTSKDETIAVVKSYTTSSSKTTITLKGKKAGSTIVRVKTSEGKVKVVIAVARSSAYKFLNKVENYSTYFKKYYSRVKYANSNLTATFSSAKKILTESKANIYVNCATPAKWALKQVAPDAGVGNFWLGCDGSVNGVDDLSKISKLSKISNAATKNNLTVKEAIEDGLLLPGDIIGKYGSNHTFIYMGLTASGKPLVYESGGNVTGDNKSNMKKVGCGPFYTKQYLNMKIKTILRWQN